MTPSAKKLAAAIETLTADAECSGGLYAEQLADQIEGVWEVPSHQAFSEICELALLAYSESDLSAEAILKNKATPALIRYVLESFKSYCGQIQSEPSAPNTQKRAEILQFAFGARSPTRGGNTRNVEWNEAKKMEIYSVFSRQLHSSHSAGIAIEAAWQEGFNAAYEFAFGSDSSRGREPRDIKKNQKKLEALMNEHQPRSTIFKCT